MALFGLSSPAGVSLAVSSAPKITQNSAHFRSQNFKEVDFCLCEAQNAVNPDGFTSILTMQRRKSVL
ncbi:MAG: hypothetical protein MJ076_05955 [Clostridia bacterium]|nr:hypothetical protein [Clostridia bacterium]